MVYKYLLCTLYAVRVYVDVSLFFGVIYFILLCSRAQVHFFSSSLKSMASTTATATATASAAAAVAAFSWLLVIFIQPFFS